MARDIKATLTAGGQTVDMDDKSAAEGLIKDILIKRFPEFKGGKMAEIRAELKNIRGVQIQSKVTGDKPPKVVTAIKFEYDGEPSEVEQILMLEAQGRPLNADLYSPQAALPLED